MIHSLRGMCAGKSEEFLIVEISGVGIKVYASPVTLEESPAVGTEIFLFTHLHVREDRLDLYGFLREEELRLFTHLITVSGIGPKTALGIFTVASADQLIAAIASGKADLLTRASGIGKKTAERIILDLKSKIRARDEKETITRLEEDVEVEDALQALGYSRSHIKEALKQVPDDISGVQDRLKAALQQLNTHIQN